MGRFTVETVKTVSAPTAGNASVETVKTVSAPTAGNASVETVKTVSAPTAGNASVETVITVSAPTAGNVSVETVITVSTRHCVKFLAMMVIMLNSFALQAKVIPVTEKISLWEGKAPLGDGNFSDENPAITIHHPFKPNGAMVIICPGGGYGGLVTGPEGHGIAKWLNENGITGVVLEYRLPKGRPAVPLLDALQAIRIARSKAGDWGCDPNRIGIIGFSAGGHLASTAATHFDTGDAKSKDPVSRMSSRPDFAILIYPVITMGELTHQGSRRNLLGPDPSAETILFYSSEKQVSDHTPPTYLAHAQDDDGVVPENSKLFYDALQLHQIPSVYLKLPSGGHGLDGYQGSMWDAWQTGAIKWLHEIHII